MTSHDEMEIYRRAARAEAAAKSAARMARFERPTVVNKRSTCNCGCGGRDPWHRRTYRRTVRNITTTDAGTRQGFVTMPYSTQPVRVTEDPNSRGPEGSTRGTWYVDWDSVE